MLQKVIAKLKSEMDKNSNNPYIQVVGSFLFNYLESSPEAAEKILTEDKTIIKSLDAMKNEASKKKIGNCAVLTDQEGFDIVLKYFGITKKTQTSSELEQSVCNKKDTNSFSISLEDLL